MLDKKNWKVQPRDWNENSMGVVSNNGTSRTRKANLSSFFPLRAPFRKQPRCKNNQFYLKDLIWNWFILRVTVPKSTCYNYGHSSTGNGADSNTWNKSLTYSGRGGELISDWSPQHRACFPNISRCNGYREIWGIKMSDILRVFLFLQIFPPNYPVKARGKRLQTNAEKTTENVIICFLAQLQL